MKNQEAHFSVVYEGQPIEDGSMDVKDLAPALLGLADVIDEINNTVTGGAAVVSLRVRNVRKGSFHIDMTIAQDLHRKFVEIFSSDALTAWATFLSLLGLSGIGLIQLIKTAKGRKPTFVEIEHTEKVRVTFEGDAQHIEIDKDVAKLFNNPRARAGVARLVKPIRKEGMSSVSLYKDDEEKQRVEITAEEAKYFAPLSEHEGEMVFESERVVKVISLSFKKGQKWKVSEGGQVFSVSILDDDFVKRVEASKESFRANDFLRVVLRTRQWYEGNDLNACYEIVYVKQHASGDSEPPPRLGLDP